MADGFSKRQNCHHTFQKLDGQHVAMQCPPKGWELYALCPITRNGGMEVSLLKVATGAVEVMIQYLW